MPSQSDTRKKAHSPPKVNTLTIAEANQSLIEQTGCGDKGAEVGEDLWHVFYPQHEPEADRDSRASFGEEAPAQFAVRFAAYVGGTVLAACLLGWGLSVVAK